MQFGGGAGAGDECRVVASVNSQKRYDQLEALRARLTEIENEVLDVAQRVDRALNSVERNAAMTQLRAENQRERLYAILTKAEVIEHELDTVYHDGVSDGQSIRLVRKLLVKRVEALITEITVEFHSGDTVVLMHLSRNDLNGCKATVQEYDESKRRWNVDVDKRSVAVKSINMLKHPLPNRQKLMELLQRKWNEPQIAIGAVNPERECGSPAEGVNAALGRAFSTTSWRSRET
jgi:hypothetical protein